MEKDVNVAPTRAEIYASKLYHLLKSYNSFDKVEILGVIQSQLSPTVDEQCFIGTYFRARGNVESILDLKHEKHFQAAAMLARGIFELAVDIKMLTMIPNSGFKMLAFNDVEKLRCARKVISYKSAHPDADVDTSIFQSFIDANATRIEALRKSIWPNMEDKQHWTGLRLANRVSQVGTKMSEIYQVNYPRLSWYAHSGLVGVFNLKAETFLNLYTQACYLAAECYREVLETVILKFHINKATTDIDSRLFVAKALPLNDNPEVEARLMRQIQK